MNEGAPNIVLENEAADRMIEQLMVTDATVEDVRPVKERVKFLLLEKAKELFESHETFPFPGTRSGLRDRLKAEQDDYPGFSTPINVLLNRFDQEGMKVVLGAESGCGNVYVIPANSDDVYMDNLFPRHLALDKITDERVRALVRLDDLYSLR